MKSTATNPNAISIGARLVVSESERQRLMRLQALFAQACNQLAPVAQQTRCWNRVTLHHQHYRALREQFPQLGSQMVCNVIYAVSRACRVVYQGPQSPFNIRRRGAKPLPLLGFMPTAPVYFDRHTLTLKGQQVSLFTLEGRLRCETELSSTQLTHLATDHIQEIALSLRDGCYMLDFKLHLSSDQAHRIAPQRSSLELLAEHVLVQDRPDSEPEHPSHPSPRIAP